MDSDQLPVDALTTPEALRVAVLMLNMRVQQHERQLSNLNSSAGGVEQQVAELRSQATAIREAQDEIRQRFTVIEGRQYADAKESGAWTAFWVWVKANKVLSAVLFVLVLAALFYSGAIPLIIEKLPLP